MAYKQTVFPTAIKKGCSDSDDWGMSMKSLSAHSEAKHGFTSLFIHMQISKLVLTSDRTKKNCVCVYPG